MKVLKFSDSILVLILVKNQGLRGSEGVKKNQKKSLHFDPKYICVPKMKFLGPKMKKFLFAGYTLPLIDKYARSLLIDKSARALMT